MMLYFFLKYLHVIGAAVLLGTGAAIALFMLRAHLTGVSGHADQGNRGRSQADHDGDPGDTGDS